MIVVTGAMGFIGSGFISYLNAAGIWDILAVDDFYQWRKEKNLNNNRIHDYVHRDLFLNYFEKLASQVEVVFHLGARTDTISDDKKVFDELNLNYSKAIWDICTRYSIPLVYASSAATYGDGSHGFEDDHEKTKLLKPLNAYAQSKQDFDLWALDQKKSPPYWYGLKFFNVYGPNEYHKARMASVIFHAFHQIQQTGALKLFKSHRNDFTDGGQQRDFIYVKDVHEMCYSIFKGKPDSGLYNTGTGKARTFEDLGKASFAALNVPVNIEYIDMPTDLRDKYQYFTEANMSKWKSANLPLPATSLEDGVTDYIKNYLLPGKFL